MKTALALGGGVILLVLALGGLSPVPLNDDFSYARSALALAETGKIAYNGWGSPLLLAQALLAAPWLKLFGFSYTLLHVLGLLAAGATTSLLYLLARRCGLERGMALAATLQLALCPIFLGAAPTFLTDLFSLVLLLGFLLCLGHAPERRSAWGGAFVLGLAACANRQLMTVAVVAPLALLGLLHPTQRRLAWGGAALLGGLGCLLAFWGSRQPYLVTGDPEGFLWADSHPLLSALMVHRFFRMLGLFLLPWTLPSLWGKPLRWPVLGGLLVLCFLPFFIPTEDPNLSAWSPRFELGMYGQYLTSEGIRVGDVDAFTPRPTLLPPPLPALLFVLGALGLAVSGALILMEWKSKPTLKDRPKRLAWLALASALSQLVVMLPWLAQRLTFDRYLLPVLPGLILFHACSLSPQRPRFLRTLPLIAACLSGLVGIAFARDYFLAAQARATLWQALRQRGVAPEAIDGGVELNGDTQLILEGQVNDKRVAGYRRDARGENVAFVADRFPAIHARYRLSYSPTLDESGWQALAELQHTYRTPLPPFTRTVFVHQRSE